MKARLERMNPNVSWLAASTVGQILSRAGLTNPKRKKRRATPSSQPFSMVTAPNQLWCMDFKGYFLTGDGYRCDPFTITDAHSRFLIRCQAVARMDLAQVSAVCDAAMREYGMPERIRTDNGAPFAGVGLLGLPFVMQNRFYRDPEKYKEQLWEFIESGRPAGNPRNLAGAMAGLPELSWKRSLDICQQSPCQFPLAQQVWPDFMRRRFPVRLRELLAVATPEDAKAVLARSKTTDPTYLHLKKHPEEALLVLKAAHTARRQQAY